MYLDFEDYRPDIQPIGRAISWREGVLLSIIVHLVMVIVLLLVPKLFPFDPNAARARALVVPEPPREPAPRFVFVQPRRDTTAPRPPDRGDASDKDRMARTLERAPTPTNPLPFARGNTPEPVENLERPPSRGEGPRPDPGEGRQAENRPQDGEGEPPKLPESQSALQLPSRAPSAQPGANGRAATPGGGLGEALRNLQRYVQRETFDNPQGGGGQFGPEIQFDTKGVEFGPWVRRFIAQVKSNWLIPYAAMSSKGHVVITFNVHKNGSITDLMVVGPSPVDPFNHAAFGALSASNPTQPLPPEYPSDKAFFTVTFFYNEAPPR
jgi:TonB family protein